MVKYFPQIMAHQKGVPGRPLLVLLFEWRNHTAESDLYPRLAEHGYPPFRDCLYCWPYALRSGPFDGATRKGTGATGSGRNSKEESDEADVMTRETAEERDEVLTMIQYHRWR